MAWPHIFASLSGSVPASYLDDNFNAACPLSSFNTLNTAVGTILVGGNLTAPAQLILAGTTTASGVSGTLNDYSPTGLGSATTLKIATTGLTFLTGISGGVDGRELVVENIGTSPIVCIGGGLTGMAASSAAANRLQVANRTYSIAPGGTVMMVYEGTIQRWRLAISDRETLWSNRTYYVGTTGSDGNDGLSSGSAFLTLQAAVNAAAFVDFNTFTVTIQIADGTYAGNTAINGTMVGQQFAAQFVIQGNVSTPANVLFNYNTASGFTVNATQGARVSIKGIKFSGASVLAHIASQVGSRVEIGSCDFGAAGNYQIYGFGAGSYVEITAAYTISGGSQYHYGVQDLAMIRNAGQGVTLTGTPAFSGNFANAYSLGYIEATGITFTGSATGSRYNAGLNSVINTNGGGANYFPGNAAGTTAAGGQYA